MSVTFVFSVDGDEFTVTRVTKQRGLSQHRLSCAARRIDVSGEDAVKSAVEDALHLDAEAFLHTVLLPQGKHAELLTKKDSDRNKILSDLFQLDQLTQVAEHAKIHESRADAALTVLTLERARLPGDAQGLVLTAKVALATAAEELRKGKLVAEQIEQIEGNIMAKNATLSQIRSKREKLTGIDDIPAALAELEAEDATLRAQLDICRSNVAKAETDKTRAERDAAALQEQRVDKTSVLGFLSTLVFIETSLREISRERSEATSHLDHAAAGEARCAALAADLKLHEGAYSEVQARVVVFESRLRDTRIKKDTLEPLIAAQATALKSLSIRAGELELKANDLSEACGRLDNVNLAAEKARTQHQLAVEAHAQARVAAGAAAIAVHLHAGDDCPVCLRSLPEAFVAPVAGGLRRARAEEDTTREVLQAAEAAKSGLEARISTLRVAHLECAEQLKLCEDEVRASLTALATVLDSPTQEPAEALAALVSNIDQDESALSTERNAGDNILNLLNQVRTIHATFQQQVISSKESADRLAASLAARERYVAEQAALFPARFSPGPDGHYLDSAREALKQALAAATEAESSLTTALQEINDALGNLAALEHSRASSIVAAKARLYERLQSVQIALSASSEPDEELGEARLGNGGRRSGAGADS